MNASDANANRMRQTARTVKRAERQESDSAKMSAEELRELATQLARTLNGANKIAARLNEALAHYEEN
jgi:hypothetical protein